MTPLFAGFVSCVLAWEVLGIALAWLRDGIDV